MLVDCRFDEPLHQSRQLSQEFGVRVLTSSSPNLRAMAQPCDAISIFSLTKQKLPKSVKQPAETMCSSIEDTLDELEHRNEVYQKDYWEMMYDGPKRFRDSRRFPDEDSIEVRFGLLKPSDCLGDWNGTAAETNATGCITDLSSRKRKSSVEKCIKESKKLASFPSPKRSDDGKCLCSRDRHVLQQVTSKTRLHFLSMSIQELPRKRSILLRHIRECAETCGRWKACCGGSHCDAECRPDWKVLEQLEKDDIVYLQDQFPYSIDFPFLQAMHNKKNESF